MVVVVGGVDSGVGGIDDPVTRLRDLAAELDVTERTAYGIVADLAEAGYVVKEREGRRNRYHIQTHLPLRDSISRERTIGEIVELFTTPHHADEIGSD